MQQATNFIKRVVALVTLIVALMQLYKVLKENGVIDQLKAAFEEFKRMSLEEVSPKFELSSDEDNMNIFNESVAEVVAKEVKAVATPKVVKSVAKAKKAVKTATKAAASVSPRAKTLLNYIKSRKQITVAEIRDQFPTVTARTLRRDLEKLEKQGVIAQSGKTRNSSYHFVA